MAERGAIYIQGPKIWLRFDDAMTVTNETHIFSNEVVSQTLENGAPLVDHIIVLQDELECQIFVSNNVFQDSQDVYAAVKTLRNTRALVNVYTGHEIYSNMAIESVNAPHEAPNVNCLTFTIKFKKIDWSEDVDNNYPLARYELPLVPQLQAYSSNVANNVYKEEQQNRISEGMKNAQEGVFPGPADVETSAVAKSDYGELLALDNAEFPATVPLQSIIEKIFQRNNFTEEEIETFFAAYVGDVTISGIQNILAVPNTENMSLAEVYDTLLENMSFLPSLSFVPMTFNSTVAGQVIQFEMYYNELLHVWKAELRDAIGEPVVENMTLLAGVNNIEGLQLKYQRLNQDGKITVEDLVLTGLYITEPIYSKQPEIQIVEDEEKNPGFYEKGIESSKYAFTETQDGSSPCYIGYFTDEVASEIYRKYINGGQKEQSLAFDELGDYEMA